MARILAVLGLLRAVPSSFGGAKRPGQVLGVEGAPGGPWGGRGGRFAGPNRGKSDPQTALSRVQIRTYGLFGGPRTLRPVPKRCSPSPDIRPEPVQPSRTLPEARRLSSVGWPAQHQSTPFFLLGQGCAPLQPSAISKRMDLVFFLISSPAPRLHTHKHTSKAPLSPSFFFF